MSTPDRSKLESELRVASLQRRVLATWQRAFPELTDPLDEPGTSILTDPQTPPTAWVSLWPVGQRVVTRVAPDVAEQLRAVLDELPPGHRLTADDVATCWPDRSAERAPQRLHALDPATFRPASPASGQQVRELTGVDRADFEEFLGQCSPDDREEGDVDIGGEHELTMGVQVGDRLVAVASMFEWRGFSDLGVVTVPQWRRQGAGRAVVSALCEHLARRSAGGRLPLLPGQPRLRPASPAPSPWPPWVSRRACGRARAPEPGRPDPPAGVDHPTSVLSPLGRRVSGQERVPRATR
jgi:GNAT superfamily N-acetyltransferase